MPYPKEWKLGNGEKSLTNSSELLSMFNPTWHKEPLGEIDSSLFNEGSCHFPRGDNSKNE